MVLGARSVPEARWTNYGALAFLIGKPAIAVARVLESAEVKVGRDMTEQRDRPPSEWLVPWHRIRMADGSVKARGGDVTREHRVHQLWVDEGGVEARPLVASESVFFQPAANSDNQRLAAARQSSDSIPPSMSRSLRPMGLSADVASGGPSVGDGP